jgi:hypothetical protein
MKPKKPLEKDIQKQILDYLALCRILAWRNQSTGIFDPRRGVFRTLTGLKGVPDILGILFDGTFLGIEVKRPGGRMSPEQQAFMAQAKAKGACVFMAESVGAVEKELELWQQRP